MGGYTMRNKLIRRLGFVTGFALVAGGYLGAAQVGIVDNPDDGIVDVRQHNDSLPLPDGQARMAAMVEAGTCWTGGDGHPYPSRVWIQTVPRNGGAAYELRGQRVTNIALEDLFTSNPRVDFVAFCK
jgi:hypothetical protein